MFKQILVCHSDVTSDVPPVPLSVPLSLLWRTLEIDPFIGFSATSFALVLQSVRCTAVALELGLYFSLFATRACLHRVGLYCAGCAKEESLSGILSAFVPLTLRRAYTSEYTQYEVSSTHCGQRRIRTSVGRSPTGLQPVPIGHSGICPWSRRGDSNPRPAVYKTAALPLSYVGAPSIPCAFNL